MLGFISPLFLTEKCQKSSVYFSDNGTTLKLKRINVGKTTRQTTSTINVEKSALENDENTNDVDDNEAVNVDDDWQNFEHSALSLLAPVHASKESIENKIQEKKDDQIYLPPWLKNYSSSNKDDGSEEINFIQAQYHVQILKATLSRPHIRGKLMQTAPPSLRFSENYSKNVINEIIEAVVDAAKGNFRLVIGASEFLCLMIRADDHTIDEKDFDLDRNIPLPTVVSRDTLIAAAFHYCDCVMAREAGIYNIVKDAMRMTPITRSNGKLLSPSKIPDSDEKIVRSSLLSRQKGSTKAEYLEDDVISMDADNSDDSTYKYSGSKDGSKTNDEGDLVLLDNTDQTRNSQYRSERKIKKYGEEAERIAINAAQIKRAELMAESIYTSDSLPNRVTPLPPEAERTRGLILSMTEDWRALVIRAVACLFRLRGILRHSKNEVESKGSLEDSGNKNNENGSIQNTVQTPESMRIAREALQIYAPLAQRVGYYRLKADLENMAFRILYPRQYTTAELMYEKKGSKFQVQSTADTITGRVKEILMNDEVLIDNLDEITVQSRVKEPYSLWRKILKKRISKYTGTLETEVPQGGTTKRNPALPWSLSITQVDDCIALRVIIKAKKLFERESDESIKTRENVLCYYVQKLLMEEFPPTSSERIKDYIRVPKPNGYQSLHYTSRFKHFGQNWPFEIQVRSESMHRVAEYGFAAHWDYKVKGRLKSSTLGTGKKSIGLDAKNSSIELIDNSNSFVTNMTTDPYETNTKTEASSGVSSMSHAMMVSNYIDALTDARNNLVENRLFIFVSPSDSALDGKILSIPTGSTVADALKEVENNFMARRETDNDVFEMYLNGRVVANITMAMTNGDVLTLPCLD